MPRTVLVVEDELLILEYLADIVSDAGYDVIRTFNSDEAIEVLETRAEIFAILTDIDMLRLRA